MKNDLREPRLKDIRPDYRLVESVSIHALDEQGRATYVEGKFVLQGEELAFKGIAMEGYGGPNFSAILAESTLDYLRQRGLANEDIEEIVVEIQRKVMEGEAEMRTSVPRQEPDEASKSGNPRR